MVATEIHRQPITDSSAWTKAGIEANGDWVHVLTDAETEDLDRAAALESIDEIMNDPALVYEMELQPGDIRFVNNYTHLHGRTAFTDDPDPDPGP